MDWIEVKGDGSIPTDMSEYKVWQYRFRKGYVITAGPSTSSNFFKHNGDDYDIVAVKPKETTGAPVESNVVSIGQILLRALRK